MLPVQRCRSPTDAARCSGILRVPSDRLACRRGAGLEWRWSIAEWLGGRTLLERSVASLGRRNEGNGGWQDQRACDAERPTDGAEVIMVRLI